jgi:hypothetical protein
MQSTRSTVIRLFSFMHLGFAMAGLLFVALDIWRVLEVANPNRVFRVLFWTRIIINIGLLVALAISAKYLWQMRYYGLRFSNVVLTLELTYIFGGAILESWLATYGTFTFGMKLAETSGIGDVGVGLQVITLYPALALLVLNCVWPRRQCGGQERLPAPRPSSGVFV